MRIRNLKNIVSGSLLPFQQTILNFTELYITLFWAKDRVSKPFFFLKKPDSWVLNF